MACKSKRIDPFSLRTFLLVTGSSKGLGRCMAVKFGSRLPAGSVVLLMSRNGDGLQKTKAMIGDKSGNVRVRTIAVDLATLDGDDTQKCIENVFNELNVAASSFEQVFIVHNAATLGDVSKRLVEFDSITELRRYWDVNLTAVVVLNSVVLGHFSRMGSPGLRQKLVINISSICALQPFKSWSLYCAGKAARDMLFRTMAAEDPSIRVLNYAPGPINTHMQLLARTVTADPELKTLFQDMHEENRLLSCDQTVEKLANLLQQNAFDTGAHIDYYDI